MALRMRDPKAVGFGVRQEQEVVHGAGDPEQRLVERQGRRRQHQRGQLLAGAGQRPPHRLGHGQRRQLRGPAGEPEVADRRADVRRPAAQERHHEAGHEGVEARRHQGFFLAGWGAGGGRALRRAGPKAPQHEGAQRIVRDLRLGLAGGRAAWRAS